MAFFKKETSQKEMLFGKIVEYVKSQNWKYRIVGDNQDILEFNMGLKGKINSCRVVATSSDKEIQAFTFAPIKADKDAYDNVVEFITRANYGTKLGKFEFDYRDGEVRYQVCLPCREGVPSMKDVEFAVDCGMLMLQRYGDGLVKNIMGFGNPEKDIAEIENN